MSKLISTGEIHSELPSDDHFADQLRGFGPIGIISIVVILLSGNVIIGTVFVIPLGTILALLWVRLSHTPWTEIGYTRPNDWIRTIAYGFLLGILLKVVLKAIVMPLVGAPPTNSVYHFLAGNQTALPWAIWSMFAVGFGEETVFRGFMFQRLGKLFGTSRLAKFSIVLLTSVGFGLAHFYQGLAGAEQAVITGSVFGILYTLKKNIVLPMSAHAAYDLASLAMIYWNVEPDVAHFIFR